MRTFLLLLLLVTAGWSADQNPLGMGTAPVTSAAPSGAAGGGLAGTYPNPTVATNANLTGPITSTGNATALAAQTGTGTTFVMQASPTLTTPNIGAATGSSLSVSGSLTSTVVTGTAPLVVASTTNVPNLNASSLSGATFASPGAIGGTVASAGTFTALTDSGLTATRIPYAGTGGLLSDDSGFTRTSLALVLDANTDNTFTTGYGKMGKATSGTSTAYYLAQASNYNSTDYALAQVAAGGTFINAKSGGGGLVLAIAGTPKMTVVGGSVTFATGVPVTISDTTASTTTTGALVVGNGVAATSVTFGGGNGNVGGNLTIGGAVVSTGNVNTAARFGNTAAITTAMATGTVGFWRSGGTIGAAGDMVLQSDSAGNGAFVFRAGTTTPVTVGTISGLGSIVPGGPAAGTTNTDGFIYMATGAGTPTGVPTTFTGKCAMYYDTTANKIWVYNGSWRGVGVL